MDREKLKYWLINRQHAPVILRGFVKNWPASEWTPERVGQLLEGKPVKCRIGTRNSKDIQFEASCSYEETTVEEFISWTKGDNRNAGPLSQYTYDAHWGYIDYKYMNELFQHSTHVLKTIDWGVFGFKDRDGRQSTLWLGTSEAHTPCHYDTYGCNLVAQLYGRKKWYLWPPEESDSMYGGRIPYEESSVFSQVHVTKPDLSKHPNFKNSQPYAVVVEPGDVLYVPRHWWHYVESLETTISVNSWLELEVDNAERMKEAVTRTLMFALMSQSVDVDLDSWLNPTEDVTSHDTNLQYITQTTKASMPEATGTRTPVKPEPKYKCSLCGLPMYLSKLTSPQRKRPHLDEETAAGIQQRPSKETSLFSCSEKCEQLELACQHDSDLPCEYENSCTCDLTQIVSNSGGKCIKVEKISFEEFEKNFVSPLKYSSEINENVPECDTVAESDISETTTTVPAQPSFLPQTGTALQPDTQASKTTTQFENVDAVITTEMLVRAVTQPDVVASICKHIRNFKI